MVVKKGKMSPMFVPVVDQETPRSEQREKKGEKKDAHSRFHRTHDKSGETFGSSDVDRKAREEVPLCDYFREDASKTMPEKSWKGQRVGYFFGRNAKNVLGYHFDGKRHEEDDDVWRQTWVDVMTRTAKEKTLASKAHRKKTIEQMQQRKRKVEEDPNDYKRKEKKPQLTQKERETLALERLKKKREGEHGSSRENRYGNEDFLPRHPKPRDGGRNSQPSSSFGYRR